jgi:hypothetical protein
MADILILSLRALSDNALRNAIADTQAMLAEPLSEADYERELHRLRALVEDCRRRGITP